MYLGMNIQYPMFPNKKKTELKELKSRTLFFVRRRRTIMKSGTQLEMQLRELEIGPKTLRVKFWE
jgi:hypothetical protein